MAQIPGKTGLVALWTVLATPVFAAVPLEGRFQGPLGTLRFQTVDETGWVKGTSEGGGSCDYLAGQGVVEGRFEGTVFAGHVFLCQSGAECPEKSYPILAFYDAEEGTLSGMVKLDPGCTSPALQNRRVLTLKAANDPSQPPPSATMLARGKDQKRNVELANEAFKKALRAVSARDPNYKLVREYARTTLSHNQEHWDAYQLWGVAEMKLGNPAAALNAYGLALHGNKQNAITHYNMACAYARMKDRQRALDSLGRAAELGFDEHAAMQRDEDLAPYLASDPDFKAVAERVAQNKKRPRRNR